MTSLTAQLLLADTDPTAKIIFGAIVGVIWLIRAITSGASKQQDVEKRQCMQAEIQAERARREAQARVLQTMQDQKQPQRPQLNPQIAMRLPPIGLPPRSKPTRQTSEKKIFKTTRRMPVPPTVVKGAAQRGVRVAPPPPLPAAAIAVAPPRASTKPIASSTIADAIPKSMLQRPRASAATIRNWLTPATLKQQFMLTEVLQPPLALRETHGPRAD